MARSTHPAPRLFGRLGPPLQPDSQTLSAMSHGEPHQTVSAGDFLLAAIGGDVARRGDAIAAVIGTPRLDHAGAGAGSVADQILEGCGKAGLDFLSAVKGEFALAVADASTGTAAIAVDRFGRFPLVSRDIERTTLFASDARMIAAHEAVGRDLDPRALYDYVFFHMIPAPRSIHVDCVRLPAAHALRWESGRVMLEPYWRPPFSEHGRDRPRSVLDAVQRGVERSLSEGLTGAFLSGGLDSSTVSGCLARARPGDAPTFSIGFRADGYDEIPYARTAATHFGNQPHEYYLKPSDLPDAIERIATAFDEPFGNSSALPAYFCARLASDAGVETLLAGDGGDELFAGNTRYAAQRVFAHYQVLPGAPRRRLIDSLITRLPRRLPLVAKAQSYVDKANTPLPDRLQAYNFLALHPASEIFSDDMLADIDTGEPFRLMREIYDRPAGTTDLKRMLYLDWQQTLADNDLRKVRRSCELAGMPVRFPMLDDDLVDIAVHTPSDRLLRGRRLRDFYKEAVDGFLPRQIIDKQKHGFGLPFGVWMREDRRLRELAADSLNDLARRTYFRSEFVHNVLAFHEAGHAAYYGELAWILMVLEIWLKAWEAPAPG